MHYIQHLIYFHLNICTRWIMTSKKTAYIPFWNMMHFYIFEHWQILCFCPWFGIIDGIWHNSILKQIPLSEQNIFSNYVCKLLNYHLKSSDRIKPFQIKSICSFEQLNKFFSNSFNKNWFNTKLVHFVKKVAGFMLNLYQINNI